MSDMADAVSNLVAKMKPTEPTTKQAAVRWIDGLFFSGTIEEVKLDHRILSFIAQRNDDKKKTEGRIANFVALALRDDAFQASLTRLEAKGLIIRKTRQWGHEGRWIELSDNAKEAVATGSGELLGRQSLAQLGVEG